MAKKTPPTEKLNCKLVLAKIKDSLKRNYLAWAIFLILLLINILTIINLISSIRLHKQATILLKQLQEVKINSSNSDWQSLDKDRRALAFEQGKQVYSNIATDNFFNTLFIDWDKTNLYHNYRTSSLSFEPVFDFFHQSRCQEEFCGLDLARNNCPAELGSRCLSVNNNEIFYQGRKLKIPPEINSKEIKKIDTYFLGHKWLVAFLLNQDKEEAVYLYFWEDNKFTLITDPNFSDERPLPIKTQYGHGNGYLATTGDDNQFLFLYSGYEMIAWLYNDGQWENVSQKLPLRVSDGGFPAQIIRSGTGLEASWYICGYNEKSPKLIKLWQNQSSTIQGSLDFSYILEEDLSSSEIICSLSGDKSLEIITQDQVYAFIDQGFNNSHSYNYQSVNFSTFGSKTLISTKIVNQVLEADEDLSSLRVSSDGKTWQLLKEENRFHQADGQLFFQAEFMPKDKYYSPWFNKLGIIYYYAVDK